MVFEIYNNGDISEELNKSILLALPKNPGANECDFHGIISLMRQILKLIILKLTNKARTKIRHQIGEDHCAFVRETGIKYAILFKNGITSSKVIMPLKHKRLHGVEKLGTEALILSRKRKE